MTSHLQERQVVFVSGVRDLQILQDHGAVAEHLHQVLVVVFHRAQECQLVVGTLAYCVRRGGKGKVFDLSLFVLS